MKVLAGFVVLGLLAGGCNPPAKPTPSAPNSSGASEKRPTGQTPPHPPVQREPG